MSMKTGHRDHKRIKLYLTYSIMLDTDLSLFFLYFSFCVRACRDTRVSMRNTCYLIYLAEQWILAHSPSRDCCVINYYSTKLHEFVLSIVNNLLLTRKYFRTIAFYAEYLFIANYNIVLHQPLLPISLLSSFISIVCVQVFIDIVYVHFWQMSAEQKSQKACFSYSENINCMHTIWVWVCLGKFCK